MKAIRNFLFNKQISRIFISGWAYMRKNFSTVVTHFKTIKDDPGKFIIWFLTSIVLSLSSVWIPLILGWLIQKDLISKLMENNPLVFFSIIFLSGSVLTSINIVGAATNTKAMEIRGITLVITKCIYYFYQQLFL